MSMFYNSRGELIEPLSVLQKYCYVKAAIKIESIYYGAKKFSLQVKVYEADIELLDQGMKPLMSRPKPVERVLTGASTTMNDIPTVDDDAGSIHGSDTEEKVPEVKKEPALPAAKKPALRRTINKPK